MTSAGFSIADPEDAGTLDVVGFDTAVPLLLKKIKKPLDATGERCYMSV